MSVILLDQTPPPQGHKPFCRAEWITTPPLTYPSKNVPAVVNQERAALLEVPTFAADALPMPILSVQHLRNKQMPGFAEGLTVKFEYHASPPTPMDSGELVRRLMWSAIPTKECRRRLLSEFGQAWFDGKLSLTGTGWEGKYLPFWVISFWCDLHPIIRARERWEEVFTWLEKVCQWPYSSRT